jgi:hypothetical protein
MGLHSRDRGLEWVEASTWVEREGDPP